MMDRTRTLQMAFLAGFLVAALPIGMFVVNPSQKTDSWIAAIIATVVPMASGFILMMATDRVLERR